MQLDVAIVGAGPSGASTALHLLRALPGAKIGLFDRATLPREKPCGGAISRWGLDALRAIEGTPAELDVPHVPVRRIRVRHRDVCGEHEVSLSEPPLGVVVERSLFDAALARKAEARGALLRDGHRLVDLSFDGGAHVLSFDRGTHRDTHRARFVVGADGTGSAVRRLVALPEAGPRARLVVLETEPARDEDVDHAIEFDLTPIEHGVDGYVWHFPTTFGGGVSRGIFDWRGRRAGDATELRDVLSALLVARGVDPKRARFKPYSERVFVSGDAAVATPRVLLVGEAAGLVDPVTGEGIAQAVVSGRVAAEHLASALDRGAIDPIAYRAGLAALRCHRHLRQTAALAPHVYGRMGASWAAALVSSQPTLSAAADWYAGIPLGAARKVEVGAAFGWSLIRALLRERLLPRPPLPAADRLVRASER